MLKPWSITRYPTVITPCVVNQSKRMYSATAAPNRTPSIAATMAPACYADLMRAMDAFQERARAEGRGDLAGLS
jgi:hypothetical protein